MVLSNDREVRGKIVIVYLPVYYCMFYQKDVLLDEGEFVVPEIVLN